MTSRKRPKSAPRSRFKRVKIPKDARDTFVKSLSNLQCRKIPEGIETNTAFPYLKNQRSFTLTKRFFQAENLSKSKGVPFDQVKQYGKKVAVSKKNVDGFHNH